MIWLQVILFVDILHFKWKKLQELVNLHNKNVTTEEDKKTVFVML